MPKPTEEEIITRAMLGDQLAFRALVESFQGFVYSIAFRFTGNEADAEDLSQECFVRLWKNLDRYNPNYAMKSWLGKMITNICLDFLKSAQRRNEKGKLKMDKVPAVADPIVAGSGMEESELRSIIMMLADTLTPKQRAAFVLRDLEMLEVNEVCEMLGESAQNIKSNLYHARKYMRENLLKYYKTSSI